MASRAIRTELGRPEATAIAWIIERQDNLSRSPVSPTVRQTLIVQAALA